MEKSISEMGPTEFLLRAVRRSDLTGRPAQQIVRRMARTESGRRRLNRFYNRLSYDEKTVFQNLFSKIFRDGGAPPSADDVWTVEFLGRTIKLPLRAEMMWLDWDNALSIVGHDTDVKITYERLLGSRRRPEIFFDIGANYGTHSLLMLACGVRAVSFEPNPVCRKEFEALCRLNELAGNMQPLAVSDRPGTARFWFPERDTWLGTMVDATKETLAGRPDLKQIEVELTTLDDFVEKSGLAPDLMKIDTEGNEKKVLAGARRTIARARPPIIFEANALENRRELRPLFDDLDYVVTPLPLVENYKILTNEEFEQSVHFNFIGLPKNFEL